MLSLPCDLLFQMSSLCPAVQGVGWHDYCTSTLVEHPLLLDMGVIFADMSVGLGGLSSVGTEGSAWVIPICV